MKYLLKSVFSILFFIASSFSFAADNVDSLIIEKIIIEGNFKTKDYVILRELDVKIADKISVNEISDLILDAKSNLLNTSLFNFVTISSTIENGKLIINVLVEERWYLWPYPILEHADRNLSSWIDSKDISKINYGAYFVKYNFRGRREILKIKTRLGYREQFAVSYFNPGLNNNLQNGLGLSFEYFRQKELAYITENNKLNFYRTNDNLYIYKSILSQITYNLRRKIYNTHNITIGFSFNQVHDTIFKLNNYYFNNNENKLSYPFLNYVFTRDCRDSKVYPLRGYYFDAGINIDGNIFSENSDLSVIIIKYSFRKYTKLGNKLFIGADIKGKYNIAGNHPYYLNKSLGYNDFLRGFEFYVIDGSSFVAIKSNLKYEIVKPRTKELSFIPLKQFRKLHYAIYTNLFIDGGKVSDMNSHISNTLVNKWLYSAGIGIDFVTYYDKIFRIEASLNSLKQPGLYFHLGAPIFSNN